jgi:hypothetical protein
LFPAACVKDGFAIVRPVVATKPDLGAMPSGQLIFFAIWLAAAVACGALIVFAWERWRAKNTARGGAGVAPPSL